MSFKPGDQIFYPCHGYGTVLSVKDLTFPNVYGSTSTKVYVIEMRSGIEIFVPFQDTSCLHPVPPPDGVQCVPCKCANLRKNLSENPKVLPNNSEE